MPYAIVDWPLSPYTGWGNYGIQLVQALLAQGRLRPLPGYANDHTPFCDPLWLSLLRDLEREACSLRSRLVELAEQGERGWQLSTNAHICFTPLGNGITVPRCTAAHQIGVTFFECSTFAPVHLGRLSRYELVVAGSRWNRDLLREFGCAQAELVHQGVDGGRFHPAPVPRLLDHSLVIFSGGKLEARKGQDVVIAAFREFVRRHPDALLMVAWGNVGGVALSTIDAMPHVEGHPGTGRAGDLAPWLEANGIPLANVLLLPSLVNLQLPNLIKQADVAVFASRCEGGTNLMAMETLACGVPTVVSANTGHLDLLSMDIDHCLPVGAAGLGQVSEAITGPYGGDPRGLWGETNPAELVELWERIATEKDEWRARGYATATQMKPLTWQRSMQQLLTLLEERGVVPH